MPIRLQDTPSTTALPAAHTAAAGRLAGQSNAYGQLGSPFNDITAGDNWYYNAGTGYDQATGIGSLNVANLDAALAPVASGN